MKWCQSEGCDRRLYARGLCKKHYAADWRRRAGIEPATRYTSAVCSFEGCGHPRRGRGLCVSHWRQLRAGKELAPLNPWIRTGLSPRRCSLPYCRHLLCAKGLCKGHYQQQLLGQELRPLRVRTGRIRTGPGYIILTSQHDHPNAMKAGRLFEHVKVMTEILGRPLLPGETVHHKNGVRDDNRPANLELWVTRQPYGQRVDDLVEWAVEVLRRYAPDAAKGAGMLT